ncbi:glutaminyl-peptide cyclotransferase [Rhodococcus kronopolitis]|uniref:Glutaminyl-peptide cyclotransferase n=1 Tax=Rhodococcus kronopolitis TaxID=1460226 RepID=A0ABV9FN30_9NOCA
MTRHRPLSAALAAAVLALSGCAADPSPTATDGVERLRVEVLRTLPHDPTAFTQGLEIAGDELLEGTGLSGRSYLSARDLDTGVERVRVPLPAPLFGEGVTVAGDTVWQLTWRDGIAVAHEKDTLAERLRVRYDGEGWGLCAQPDRLVMSDGTDTLTFRDPVSFDARGSVPVTRDGAPQSMLNELECASDGSVYANVWQTDEIVRIDPETGRVTAVIDAAGLLTEDERRSADVLNGIAQLPGTDRFLVTGKFFPHMFEVRFVP